MAPDSEAPPPQADDERLEAPAAERSGLVGSPQALAAHDALVALTKAARSFTLYDPANKVVRKLIGEYREKTRHVLDTHGKLVLVVHPYELRLGDEVVYKDADRERSLAFRLFRDGIRRVQFEPTTTWEELVRLLQILSIAFTAIRQQEDDLVTLLRKAGFEHIRITAIEGFLPEEEQTEESLVAATQHAGQERRDPPAHWDLPFPPLKEAAPLRYRTVSEELLERLRAEEAETTVAPEAVRVALELLHLAAGTDLKAETVFALEAREFLIVEGRADLVIELARGARPMLRRGPGGRRVLRHRPAGRAHAPGAGAGAAPGRRGAAAGPGRGAGSPRPGRSSDGWSIFWSPRGAGPRAPLLRRLVAHSCGVSSNIVVARLHETEGASRVALMQLLAEVDPGGGPARAAMEATTSEEEAVQLEALRQLQAAELTPEIARALRHLVESSVERVRLSALPVMAERGKARVMPTLAGPRGEEARLALGGGGGGDGARPRHLVSPGRSRHLQGVAGAEGGRAAGTKDHGGPRRPAAGGPGRAGADRRRGGGRAPRPAGGDGRGRRGGGGRRGHRETRRGVQWLRPRTRTTWTT